jgi:hypothetical protein
MKTKVQKYCQKKKKGKLAVRCTKGQNERKKTNHTVPYSGREMNYGLSNSKPIQVTITKTIARK